MSLNLSTMFHGCTATLVQVRRRVHEDHLQWRHVQHGRGRVTFASLEDFLDANFGALFGLLVGSPRRHVTQTYGQDSSRTIGE